MGDKPKKGFDCVEMKRRGAARIYEITKNMTVEEELAYWRKETAKLKREMEQAKVKRLAGSAK